MRTLLLLLFILLAGAFSQDAEANPVIFNTSSTAAAGDVIFIQGSGLGTSPHVQYSFNDSTWVSLPVLTSGSETTMVQLPTNLGRLPDLLTVRISSNGSNWSQASYINQAKALSFDTGAIGPGDTFRIFGRNLMFSRAPSVRLVDTADHSSHVATVNHSTSTSYALTVQAPSDIYAGHTYSVLVSNGYNGNGHSGGETTAPSTLSGRWDGYDYFGLNVPWAADLNFYQNVYNVQTDPRLSSHAKGDGSAGDLSAIQGAIGTAAAAGGGIVYLPPGTYNLYYPNACGLTLQARVVLMGASASSTFVNFGFGAAPTPDDGGWAVCMGNSLSGVADITFTNVNQSGKWPQSATSLNAERVFMQRTNWKIANAQWVVFQNCTNATMQNSSIVQGVDPSYNGPLSMIGSTNFLLRENTIKFVAGSLMFNGITDGVFEKNTVIRDASQSAPSWVITHVVIANFATNFMLLNNKFEVTGGTLPQRNDGETIGTEGGGPTRYDEFRGTVQGAGSNSISDWNQNFNWSSNNAVPNLHVGSILAIVSGTGTGQWATITAISSDGHTVWVNNPWVVTPGTGSHYATFDWSAANWIVAENTLSDNEKGIEMFDSSIRDILITGNKLTNNGEILISPTQQPNGAGLFNLVINTQITGNTLVDNNNLRPAAISAVPREDSQNTNFGTSIIGLEMRKNSITGHNPSTVIQDPSLDDSKALTEGFNLYWQWQTTWSNFVDTGLPSIVGTVLQGNILNNSTTALMINSGVYETALCANVLNSVSSQRTDVTIPGAGHASVGTILVMPVLTTPPPPTNSSRSQVTVLADKSWITRKLSQSGATLLGSELTTGTPALGDYDGDGLVDPVVFNSGNFTVQLSSNKQEIFTEYVGMPGDIPVPGDYDGDGKTDFAIYRPSNSTFYYEASGTGGNPIIAVQTPSLNGDIPVPGDYDGDGKTDFVFFRPSQGNFLVTLSSNMSITFLVYFSNADDIAVPGDYDGDGRTDYAVFRPSTGDWYYQQSSTQRVLSFHTQGTYGDVPVPGDYDADGKTDFAIWRPGTQTWYLNLSSNVGTTVSAQMGTGSSTPVSGTPNTKAAKANLTVH